MSYSPDQQPQYPSPYPSTGLQPPMAFVQPVYPPADQSMGQMPPASTGAYPPAPGAAPTGVYVTYSPQPPQPAVYPAEYEHPQSLPPQASIPLQDMHSQSGLPLDDVDADIRLDDERRPPHLIDPYDVHVSMSRWFRDGWHLFCQYWLIWMLFEVVRFALPGLAYWIDEELIGSWIPWPTLLFWPLVSGIGYFTAGAEVLRQKERAQLEGNYNDFKPTLRFSDFVRPYYLYFPLLLIYVLYYITVSVGLLLLIIPGIYFAITFAFAPFIYIEYHRQRNHTGSPYAYGIIDSFSISRSIVHAHFCHILGFMFLCMLIYIGGVLLIPFVGTLIVGPFVNLAGVAAFRDLFQIQPHRQPDNACYCL